MHNSTKHNNALPLDQQQSLLKVCKQSLPLSLPFYFPYCTFCCFGYQVYTYMHNHTWIIYFPSCWTIATPLLYYCYFYLLYVSFWYNSITTVKRNFLPSLYIDFCTSKLTHIVKCWKELRSDFQHILHFLNQSREHEKDFCSPFHCCHHRAFSKVQSRVKSAWNSKKYNHACIL